MTSTRKNWRVSSQARAPPRSRFGVTATIVTGRDPEQGRLPAAPPFSTWLQARGGGPGLDQSEPGRAGHRVGPPSLPAVGALSPLDQQPRPDAGAVGRVVHPAVPPLRTAV